MTRAVPCDISFGVRPRVTKVGSFGWRLIWVFVCKFLFLFRGKRWNVQFCQNWRMTGDMDMLLVGNPWSFEKLPESKVLSFWWKDYVVFKKMIKLDSCQDGIESVGVCLLFLYLYWTRKLSTRKKRKEKKNGELRGIVRNHLW